MENNNNIESYIESINGSGIVRPNSINYNSNNSKKYGQEDFFRDAGPSWKNNLSTKNSRKDEDEGGVEKIIRDLNVFKRQLEHEKKSSEEVTNEIKQYFVDNSVYSFLEEVYHNMSEVQRKNLAKDHRELNEEAAKTVTGKYILSVARKILRDDSDLLLSLKVSDDDIAMIQRGLYFARYIEND